VRNVGHGAVLPDSASASYIKLQIVVQVQYKSSRSTLQHHITWLKGALCTCGTGWELNPVPQLSGKEHLPDMYCAYAMAGAQASVIPGRWAVVHPGTGAVCTQQWTRLHATRDALSWRHDALVGMLAGGVQNKHVCCSLWHTVQGCRHPPALLIEHKFLQDVWAQALPDALLQLKPASQVDHTGQAHPTGPHTAGRLWRPCCARSLPRPDAPAAAPPGAAWQRNPSLRL